MAIWTYILIFIPFPHLTKKTEDKKNDINLQGK